MRYHSGQNDADSRGAAEWVHHNINVKEIFFFLKKALRYTLKRAALCGFVKLVNGIARLVAIVVKLRFYSCFCRFSFSWKEPNQIQRGWLKRNVTILQEESPKCLSLPLGNWEAYPEPAQLFSLRSACYWRSVLESRFFGGKLQESTRWNERCCSCGLFGWCWCSQTVDGSSTITSSKIPRRFLAWGTGKSEKPSRDILWVRF